MFLTGVVGSASIANVAGTIVDLFGDVDGNGQAMALFVFSAELGPGLGSPVGAWITTNPNMGYKWIFLVNVLIGAVFTFFLCFVPETLPRYAIANAAAKKSTEKKDVVTLRQHIDITDELKFIFTMTFKILTQEPIVLCLGLYNGFAFGLMFLYLDGVFDVFMVNNHLS